MGFIIFKELVLKANFTKQINDSHLPPFALIRSIFQQEIPTQPHALLSLANKLVSVRNMKPFCHLIKLQYC